jgi:hypothetical protein
MVAEAAEVVVVVTEEVADTVVVVTVEVDMVMEDMVDTRVVTVRPIMQMREVVEVQELGGGTHGDGGIQ